MHIKMLSNNLCIFSNKVTKTSALIELPLCKKFFKQSIQTQSSSIKTPNTHRLATFTANLTQLVLIGLISPDCSQLTLISPDCYGLAPIALDWLRLAQIYLKLAPIHLDWT